VPQSARQTPARRDTSALSILLAHFAGYMTLAGVKGLWPQQGVERRLVASTLTSRAVEVGGCCERDRQIIRPRILNQ
jgi:hypothetical protein